MSECVTREQCAVGSWRAVRIEIRACGKMSREDACRPHREVMLSRVAWSRGRERVSTSGKDDSEIGVRRRASVGGAGRRGGGER